jgi:hypothetical protein
MDKFFKYLLLSCISLFILFIIAIISWHYFAFKWIFQFIASFSILIIGLAFLISGFKVAPRNRVALGLLFIFLLSPIAYYGSDYLFWDNNATSKTTSFNGLRYYLQNKWNDNPASLTGAFIWIIFNLILLILWAKGNTPYLGRKFIAFNIIGFLLFSIFLVSQ